MTNLVRPLVRTLTTPLERDRFGRRIQPALLWPFDKANRLQDIGRIGDDPTFSRGSKAWAFVNGVLTQFAADEPALTENGYLHEPQRTNKCQNFNASPTDLTGVNDLSNNPISNGYVSIVSDQSARDSAGIGSIGNGNAIQFDIPASAASGDYTVFFSGQTGNTNDHTLTTYARQTSGGAVRVGLSGQVGTLTPGTAYEQVIQTQTPSTTTKAYTVGVPHTNGTRSTAYFTLNQLEEGATATSPIVVAGAAVTRNEPSQTTPVNGSGQPDVSGGCTLVVRSNVVENSGSPTAIVRLEDAATNFPGNQIALRVSGGPASNDLYAVSNNTVITDSGGFLTIDGSLHTVVLRISPNGHTAWEDGSQVLSSATDYSTVLANVTDLRIGYQVQGEYPFARLYTSLLSDSECQRLSNET